MDQNKAEYFARRVEESRQKAALASSDSVRETHEKFAAAYAERAAEAKLARSTVNELLG